MRVLNRIIPLVSNFISLEGGNMHTLSLIHIAPPHFKILFIAGRPGSCGGSLNPASPDVLLAPVDDVHLALSLIHIFTEGPDGTLQESEHYTGMWAWKHPHKADETVTYTRLCGDVQFEDVTFSYDGEKTVLHDVSLYAKPGQKIAFVGSTGAGKDGYKRQGPHAGGLSGARSHGNRSHGRGAWQGAAYHRAGHDL